MESSKYWYMFTCVQFLQPYVHPNNIYNFSSLPTKNTILSFWRASYSCLGKHPAVCLKYGLGKISISHNTTMFCCDLYWFLPIDITCVYSQNRLTDWAEREIFIVRAGSIKGPPPYFSGLKNNEIIYFPYFHSCSLFTAPTTSRFV